MLILTRIHTRLTPNVPFFCQLATDPRTWNTSTLYKALKSKLSLYEPRYTADVLTKTVVWTFEDQETFDSYVNDANVKKRELVLKAYNQRNNISCIDSLVTMTNEEFESYKTEIVNSTLPAMCFVINVVPTENTDKLAPGAVRPTGDSLAVDPWYEYL